jgi:hypothetical protein
VRQRRTPPLVSFFGWLVWLDSIIIALMMGTETVPETLDFNELTRLSAREEFILFNFLNVSSL